MIWPSCQYRSRTKRTSAGPKRIGGRVDNGRTACRIVNKEDLRQPVVEHQLHAESIVGTRRQLCGRSVEAKQGSRNVDFPADPHHRVTVPHEQPVTEVCIGRRIGAGSRRAVEAAQQTSTAAVCDFEEEDAIALRRIARTKDVQSWKKTARGHRNHVARNSGRRCRHCEDRWGPGRTQPDRRASRTAR
jgi:hypothetical protein